MSCGGFSALSQNNKEARQKSEILDDVSGRIKLAGAPYYGLVLESGSCDIPVIPVDLARHLVHWMSSVGRKVVIKQLLAISEDFQISRENDSVEYKNFMVKWKDVITLQENGMQSKNDLQHSDEAEDTENGNISFTRREEAEDIIKSQRTCRIIVHHVSIPFHMNDTTTSATCLTLISFDNRNHLETKLWLVLRAEQVAWRDFLVPNREYLLHFPEGTDKFFFDKSQKPLDTIMEKNIRELRVIFHHKILFSKYCILGSIVPEGSKVYLCGNTNLSDCVYKFTADSLWFRFWFSTSESDYANVPLVTFYGKITEIMYLKENVFKSCYLCQHKQPNKPELKTPKNSVLQVWMDPFKSNLELGVNELVELPSVCELGDCRMKTGVPCESVQVMKLQDLVTGEERSIYVKHSYVSSCQQMARLAPGLIVCFTHLNRRCSTNGKCYYISTMLTSCRVLDYKGRGEKSPSEGWGLYGLCHKKDKLQVKTWGVLEPFNVVKVAIRASCSYCGCLFDEGKCSSCCVRVGTPIVSAYAIAFINIVHDDKTLTMEKVLIKDDMVRTLLGIPEKIWLILRDAAVQEEIVAFRDQDLSKSSDLPPLRKLFQMYCSLKSKSKFYISVKKLPQHGEGDLYYCLNLEPITSERLNIVAQLVIKETKS